MEGAGERVLLTGGRGMVGRNVLDHPAAAGRTVLAPTSAELDLTDEAAVRAYLDDARPDVVIHAAGRVGGIQANIANPVAFLEQNAAMGRNVVLASHAAGVRRLLNLASTCIYPREAPNPLREEMVLTGPLEPTNEGYALAKIFTLRLCEYVRREDPDALYKTLIPCNLYGLHDSFEPRKSHLVPAILHKLHEARRQGAREVEIWGDGTARREFMFSADLADAVWRAVDDLAALPDTMNVGPGVDHSVNDYYRIAAGIVGWDGDFVHDLSKPTGMQRKLCSVERQNAWGWRPATSLERGLAATYAHYRERMTA
jgi:GDP-L-fucose synthase